MHRTRKKILKGWFPIFICMTLAVFTVFGCSMFKKESADPAARTAGSACVQPLSAPRLTNNPAFDTTATNSRPLLSLFNATGGIGDRTYEYQISASPGFNKASTLVYRGIRETNSLITEMKIPDKDALPDGTYAWRARAVDSRGKKGPWAVTRFHIDTKNTRTFSGLVRRPVKNVTVSSGQDPKNITDWNDQGLLTFWNSSPPGPAGATQWVVLDLGVPAKVSRFWMLSNPNSASGRLLDFIWQYQTDGGEWKEIPESALKENDTFRNIIDFQPVTAQFFRLLITDFAGLQAQINCIIPYGPGTPPRPVLPKQDYVLVFGDQMNGFTYTMLADFIESLDTGLATVTVPHMDASLAMLQALDPQPVAVFVSGNNADYGQMPMFEYYGLFEIIRDTHIPLLGICAGHQFTSMAYGMTFARSMGWFDASTFRMEQASKGGPHLEWKERGIDPQTGREPIHIKKDYVGLPIFQGIPSPFLAVEIHSWAVSPLALPKDHVITAASSYAQAVKSETRHLYGAQFHGEAVVGYNQGGRYIRNFLDIALKARKEPKQEKGSP